MGWNEVTAKRMPIRILLFEDTFRGLTSEPDAARHVRFVLGGQNDANASASIGSVAWAKMVAAQQMVAKK